MNTNIKQTIRETIENYNPNLPTQEKEKIEDILVKLLAEHEIPKKVFGVPQELIELYYNKGYSLFKAGKYLEAIQIFETLRYLDPINSRYSFAIAASFHHLKDFKKAAANYILCKESNPFDPVPCFHLYDCLKKLDQPLLGYHALSEVIFKSEDMPQYKNIKEQAILERDNMTPYLGEWFEKNFDSLPKKK